jgi:hypothetical protein
LNIFIKNSYLSLYALLLTHRPCELEVYPFDSLGFFLSVATAFSFVY